MALDFEKIDLGSFGISEPAAQPGAQPKVEFETQPNVQLRATVDEAMKVNPDQHARVNKLANESGVPTFAVESNPDSVEHNLKLDKINFDQMSKRNPNTAKYLTDFNNAVIAQDDIEVLKSIEDIFDFGKTFENIGDSISLGFDSQAKGLEAFGVDKTPDQILDLVPTSALPLGVQDAAPMISRQIAKNFGIETDEQLQVAKEESVTRIISELKVLGEERQTLTPADLNTLEQGVRAGVESLANMAPGFGLMVLSGGRAAPLLSTIGVQSFGSAYGEGRAEGLTVEEATWFASIDAAIEVGTELLPTKTLQTIITGKAKGNVTKAVLKFIVREMGTEQLATLGQSINQFAFGLDEQMENAETVGEMVQIQLQRQAVTAIATVVAGGAQATAATVITKTIEKVTSDAQKKENKGTVEQQKIDQINSASEASKLKQRDSESFKQFVEDADGVNNTQVYIDSAQASLYLQEKTAEEIEADPALKLIADQVREAARLGGDVVIPVADFATDIAATPHYEALRDSMTLSAETVAPFRQEQAQEETQNYVKTLLDEAQENASEFVEAQDIFESVRTQLIDTGTVTPKNASIMAQLVPAWATVYAKKNGISVAEAYNKTGLIIEGPQTGKAEALSEEALSQVEIPVQDQEKAQDLIDEISEFSEISTEGLVTVYHRTSKESAEKIRTSGDVIPKENGIFFSTSKDGQAEGFGDTVIEFKIPADQLQLDDIFDDEAHLRLPATANESNDVSGFITSETLKQTTDGKSRTRGFYDPANSVIRLTEAADLSTFLHEFAHFMYEMEVTTDGETLQSINNWYKRNAKDVAKEANKNEPNTIILPRHVVAFLDEGTAGDKERDRGIRRAVHEQFARGFEAYLMEGKAPSIELRNAFRSFARWLTQIYRSIRGDLRVNLDTGMREVLDRMLATEEQIAAAEGRARVEPFFTDATMAGMTEEEFTDYQQRQEKVKDKQSETLRDKLIKELTRKTEKWWKEEKADIVDDEIDSLSKQQVYTTINALKTGDMKLDHATVKEMVGEEKVNKLGRKSIIIPTTFRGMTVKGGEGVHPDEAAAFFGYGSGSEMLLDIATAPKIKVQADINAENRMHDKYGDILNDGTIEKEADEAVQSEERGALILHELKMISRNTSQLTIERQVIKGMAEERIGKMSFRNIHPGKYRKAEIAAAQGSATALANGDLETAGREKARQALNYYLGMAATEAKNETISIVDRMSRYNKKKVREEIQKAGNNYWEQIVKILNRFEFRKAATLVSVDQINQDINTWAAERTEVDGDGLVLTPAVLNESFVTHWKNVPFSDLQGINDSVKNMEHVARYSNKITRLGEEQDFNKLVDQWVTSMDKNATRFTPRRTDVIEGRNWGRWFMSQMTKVPFMASWLDGGERVGISHTIMVQPFTDAYNDEIKLWDKVGRVVMDSIQGRSKADRKRHNTKVFIPEIDDNLFVHQIVAVALNTGNQGNLRKLLLGEGWADPEIDSEINLQNPKLQAVLKHLNKSDWDMVQLIWDQMELLYPQLSEVHRRTTGLTPPKVESTPVETEFGTFRGGYYPIKYDPNRSHQASVNEEKLNAQTESMFSNSASIQASVNTGTVNERTGFYGPIRLSLDVVPAHFQETIHYITHHDPVREVNKLVRNKSVTETIKAKIGPEEYAQLKPWLNDIAKDGRETPVKMFWDDLLGKLRFGVTLGTMGFKASTGIIQVSGLSNTMSEVGAKKTFQGISGAVGRAKWMQAARRILGSTTSIESAWDFAVENSKVLEHRAKTMDREIKNAMKKLEGKRGIFAAVQETSMKHIALIQTYMVDLPSWHAAYMKGVESWGDEQRAFEYADWVIENVQGSGATKDLARIMRGQSETGRMLTMFMTFFSSLWNMERDLVKGSKSGLYSKTNVAAKAMFLFAIPVLFDMLMRGQLGEPDGNEDDERLQKYLTGVATFPFQSIPFLRDVISASVGDYGYNISPLASVIEQGTRTIPELIKNGFTDDEMTKGQVKGATKFIGATLGVPGVNQMWATGEHLFDVIEEGEELTMHQLLFGPARK